ncbi:MAG TPA: SH3 domain-containing protein [Blastocatellia bacterium]|nr:SH3 domain-containing protein [Blastocatellia bacterium]
MKLLPLLACLVITVTSGAVAAPQAGARRITIASSVRLRSAPATTASVVATLQVGVVLDELGRSDAPVRVGDQEDYWYKVKSPVGATGWVFGALTRAVDTDILDDAYLRIARDRLDSQTLVLGDWIDLYGMLGRAAAGARTRDARAELECDRLRVLGRAMYAVEDGKKGQEPFRGFLASVKDQVVYSEPAGVWLVMSERYWKLYDAYRDTSYAEHIAWHAAENELPGECEGDEECTLTAFLQMEGRYITLYPKGEFVPDALKNLDELLNSLVEYGAISSVDRTVDNATTAQWKADARKALASTRATVELVDNPLKPSLLEKIAALDQKLQ